MGKQHGTAVSSHRNNHAEEGEELFAQSDAVSRNALAHDLPHVPAGGARDHREPALHQRAALPPDERLSLCA